MKKIKIPRGIIRIYPLFYLGIVWVFIGISLYALSYVLRYGLSYDEYEHIVRNINHNLFPFMLLVFIIPSIIILTIHFILSNYGKGKYIKEMYSLISFLYGLFIFFYEAIFHSGILPHMSIFLILGYLNFLVHAVFFWIIGIFFMINKIRFVYYFSIVPLLIGFLDFIFSILRIPQTDPYLFVDFFMTTIMVLISFWGLYPYIQENAQPPRLEQRAIYKEG